MKPANDPNRQQQQQQPQQPLQPTGSTPIRTVGPPVARTTAGPSTTLASTTTTNVTSHIVSTGNPPLASLKTIPVTTSRLPPTGITAMTLVGTGKVALRSVSPAAPSTIVTSIHVPKVPTTMAGLSTPRAAAVGAPMLRNIVTTPIMTPAGPGAPTTFVQGIRTVPRAPTPVATSVSNTWAGKPASAGIPAKITSAQPVFPSTPAGAPRAPTTSLTLTTRQVTPTAVAARPELATVRTTKPVVMPDKFIRAPAHPTLTFASPGQAGGPFPSSSGAPLTHLAVAPIPSHQAGQAVTLQPMVVTTSTAAVGPKITTVQPRQGGLHPIGPKVIAQPAHGPPTIITHLTGIGGKPVAQAATMAPAGVRGASPQVAAGGPQVKVLAQAPGGLLSDVLSQQGTLIPSGVFIQQVTQQHAAVNVSPLERSPVVTTAGYATVPFYYDSSAGGASLIATTGPAHPPVTHGAPSHLIRTFAPTMASSGVAMQVQASGFHSSEEARKSFPSSTASMVSARFNPVMLMEASSKPPASSGPPVTVSSHSEGGAGSSGSLHPVSHSSVVVTSHSAPPQVIHPALVVSQPAPQSQGPPPQPQQVASGLTSGPSLPASSAPQHQAPCASSSREPSTTANQPSTPTSTPSKFCASPRPSILRKRDHEGSPSKAQKNLGPVLASLSCSQPSSAASSPPPSPPGRPDSGEGGASKDGHGGNSSGGSSTISATSSPGLPCDVDNSNQASVKQEPPDMADTASNNGANGNSETMSPRKKPRKQQLTGNELQEAPYVDENVEFGNDHIKKEDDDANHKAGHDGSAGTPRSAAAASGRRRPSVSLLQTYRTCWKPRNNHFIRPTDVRPREERRLTIAELSSQKRIVQKASGWKFYHLRTQMEELGEREGDILDQLSTILSGMESSLPGAEHNKDVSRTNELIRSNMQRSKVVRDQLDECGTQLMRLLEHTGSVVDIIKKNANRRQAKKKY